MKKIYLMLFLTIQAALLWSQKDFSFIFLPDLHLQPDPSVNQCFDKVAQRVNALKPDFILTGGDMIYTAKNGDEINADMLFDLMDRKMKMFAYPVYLTMGNHETVGITKESSLDSSNPAWGKKMYEKRYNRRYYAFSFSGWKFFVLDGIKIREKDKDYTSGVDKEQIDWIKNELSKTAKNTPVVISIHTPLVNPKAMSDSDSEAISDNAEDVLKLFREHDLRIVLQGHNHIYMNLYINGVYYISGGSAACDTEDPDDRGFLMVRVVNGKEQVEFIQN